MAQAQYQTLDDVIELDADVIATFRQLVGRFHRRGAAEAVGLTLSQLSLLYQPNAEAAFMSGKTRRAPAEAYRRACYALGIEPANKAVQTRHHAPTVREREDGYTRMTPKIRADVRRFIRGRTVGDAARELGTTRAILHTMYRGQYKRRQPRAYIPTPVLSQIRDRLKNRPEDEIVGTDEHTKFSKAGYHRIEEEERASLRRFFIGGDPMEALALLSEFRTGYKRKSINHWLSPGNKQSYVDNFSYALMAAIVRLREAAGYYEILSSSSNYRTEALHVDNTPHRREAVKQYIRSLVPVKQRHKLASDTLRVPEPYLRRVALGDLRYIPAWLYVRVLEQTGLTEPFGEDYELRPYVGRSADLEKLLHEYSHSELRQTFVSKIKAVWDYLETPHQSVFALLKSVARSGRDYQQLVAELDRYAAILERNRQIFAANKIPDHKVPHSDFTAYFGIPAGESANNHAKAGRRAKYAK